jgi:hypothetical protein
MLAARFLIVAPRQSAGGVDCRARRRSAKSPLSFERGAAPIAFDVHLEDGGVMDEAVDSGERHGLVTEHRRVPLFRIERSLKLPSLILTIRCMASALI